MKDFKLLDDEYVVKTYKTHWFILLKNFLYFFGFVIFYYFLLNNSFGENIFKNFLYILSIFLILTLIKDFFVFKFNYYLITNKRLIMKEGFLVIREKEILFSKIESINTNQSIIEKFFNVGSVNIVGTGNSEITILDLENNKDFKDTLSNAIRINN